MICRLFLFVLSVLSIATGYAQVGSLSGLDHGSFHANVQFIDEFMDRFNGLKRRDDLPERFSDRASNITLLFDKSQFLSDSDTLFRQAEEFAHEVTDKGYYINYEDTTWYAEVSCKGSYDGRKVDFLLYLFVERRGEDMYKWVIADAGGELFEKPAPRRKNAFFLLPNAHELSFFSLSRAINNTGKYIDDYVIKDYPTDTLARFLDLVRSGRLTMDKVIGVEFVFHQVPGYVFRVKEIIREDVNAGWLIHSFERCGEREKMSRIGALRHVDRGMALSPDSVQSEVVLLDPVPDGNEPLSVDTMPQLSTGELVVRLFGDLVRFSSESKDPIYLKTAMKTCLQTKGGMVEVSDPLMKVFVEAMGLKPDSIYPMRKWMDGLGRLIQEGDFYYGLSRIKQIDETEEHYIVSSLVNAPFLPGEGMHELFYVSKKGNRITRIARYPGNEGF